MPGLYTHTTRASGTILTATIYNSDHQNHIDNHVPAMIDDYSVNLAQMKLTADPGESGSESLATNLAGELERIRFAIKEMKATAEWYETRQVGKSLLQEQVASASATIDFVLTPWLATFRAFKVMMTGIRPATDLANLTLRTSTDAGSSYDAGLTDYSWANHGRNSQTGTDVSLDDDTDSSVRLAGSLSNVAARAGDGEVTIYAPTDAARHTHTRHTFSNGNTSGALIMTDGSGRRTTAADVDAIRFLMSSGNITSGTFALYGIK